jgi:hypothetical protein
LPGLPVRLCKSFKSDLGRIAARLDLAYATNKIGDKPHARHRNALCVGITHHRISIVHKEYEA